MPDLKGKVALNTGASSGIGEATALHFASLGCWLSLTARNAANMEKVAEACFAQGLPRDKVLVVAGDVSVEEDVTAVVKTTVAHFGRIDILVNNAGISKSGSTDEVPMEDFDLVYAVNLRGPLCMTRAVLPYLRESKGNIVNVSSVAGQIMVQHRELISLGVQGLMNAAVLMELNVHNATAYSLSKAALDHLTRCSAIENATYGVRVNAVKPGVIPTKIGQPAGVTADEQKEYMERLGRVAHPMGRAGTPEEVARCIAFLASDDASFVTGAILPEDGGLQLKSGLSGPEPCTLLK